SYVRSTRYALPMLLQALTKGNDPDRMKGALYVLSNKGIASYSLTDQGFHKQYLLSLLGCQHEEKPSIQKLVATTAQECYSHLLEDVVHTDAYTIQPTMIDYALQELQQVFSSSFVNQNLLQEAISKYPLRIEKRTALYHETVRSILDVASKPETHIPAKWRYGHISARFLHGMSRGELAWSPECLEIFVKKLC
ncbi:hypothetical protein MPER_09161, partial [Moniliophthora perniciosa FA553]